MGGLKGVPGDPNTVLDLRSVTWNPRVCGWLGWLQAGLLQLVQHCSMALQKRRPLMATSAAAPPGCFCYDRS